MRDGHVYEAQMSGMSFEEMLSGWYASRMCCPGESMCNQAEREEGTEGEGQTNK